METSLPVALSAQLALEKRLNTIANNLANSRSAGFRAEEVKFEQVNSLKGKNPVTFASDGSTYLSTKSGEMTQTGNPLDMAVSGDAFFAIQGPNGPVYTRDGRMQIGQGGNLQTILGNNVLDVGGAPLQVDPQGGPISIATDGMITQNGAQVGAVGLFRMPTGAHLSRSINSGVVPDRPAEAVVDFAGTSVTQGYVEGSNVNPLMEMTRLIEIQRAFESASNMVQTNENSLGEAIKTLGSQS